MKIKVCGVTQKDQIEILDQESSIYLIGFIFFENSPRYYNTKPTSVFNKKKVGVFVNESEEFIIKTAENHQLEFIQLHGSECPETCERLRENFKVLKAVGIHSKADFLKLKDYENSVDYFLFDTKTIKHGGSGEKFNWDLLNEYSLNIPFFLSGGISIEDVQIIKDLKHPKIYGVDINSKFEMAPGIKNIEKINAFIKHLKQ
jgi:phosphoribosylanthranilate isomerase